MNLLQLDWHNFKYKEMKTNTGPRTADFLTANVYWVAGGMSAVVLLVMIETFPQPLHVDGRHRSPNPT